MQGLGHAGLGGQNKNLASHVDGHHLRVESGGKGWGYEKVTHGAREKMETVEKTHPPS